MNFVETEIEIKINSHQYQTYGTFDTIKFEFFDPYDSKNYEPASASQDKKN